MSNTIRLRRRSIVLRAAVVAALAALLPAAPALAGPKGARVAKGSARIETRGADTVIHAADRAVINYQSFDLTGGETVQFVQPSATARVLNRIDGGSPTHIDGAISANGRVYFVNPSGIVFGSGAKVQAAGFVAAASNLSNADFLDGVDRFNGGTGLVQNAGTIEANFVALIGGRVENTGTIVAPDGVVAMVAGNEAYVSAKDSNIRVNVTGGASGTAAGVSQTGHATAGKKLVIAAGDLYSLAVQTGGTTKAPDVAITAAPSKVAGTAVNGVVKVSGTIDASSATATGGHVAVTGDYVAVANATIDASGKTGGGTVQIGGGWQGTGPLVHAKSSFVGADATIHADATGSGTGGTVDVWSDHATGFAGTITAKGVSGGGSVETSGGVLSATGHVDTTATAGPTGTYLLDPGNIEIIATGGTAIPADGTFTLQSQDNSDTTVSQIGADAIAAQLGTAGSSGGTNVTISTRINKFAPTVEQLANADALKAYLRDTVKPNEGKIFLAAPITYAGPSDRTLTMTANAGIYLGTTATGGAAPFGFAGSPAGIIASPTAGKLSVVLRSHEGFRYTLAELKAAQSDPDFGIRTPANLKSLLKGDSFFIDSNLFGIETSGNPNNVGVGAYDTDEQQIVGLGPTGGGRTITIDTNGGDLIASGRGVRGFFQNTNVAEQFPNASGTFPNHQFGFIFSQANISTHGGDVDFRSSGTVQVGNITTAGGAVRLYSAQSYTPGALIAGAPGADAQFIYQATQTSIDAGSGDVDLSAAAELLAGDHLNGGDITIRALGIGPTATNSDIAIDDFVSEAKFFFKEHKLGVHPTSPQYKIDEAAARYRRMTDPTFRQYEINGTSVQFLGNVRVYPGQNFAVNASASDVNVSQFTRPVDQNGTPVNKTLGGNLEGLAFVTLSAPSGTVRVDQAVGAPTGRSDVGTAPANSVPLRKFNVDAKQIAMGTIIAQGPVRLHAAGTADGGGVQDGDIRVVGNNPVWLTTAGTFNVDGVPQFDVDDGSVAPIFVSQDLTLDPNRNLFEFDIRRAGLTDNEFTTTFTPPAFLSDKTALAAKSQAFEGQTFQQATFSPTATTAAREIAGAVPQETRGIEPGRGIATDVATTLARVGVTMRDVREDELIESLFGRGFYNDVGRSTQPTVSRQPSSYIIDRDAMRSDLVVAKPRVPSGLAEAVVAQFNATAMRPVTDPATGRTKYEPRYDEIKTALGTAADDYKKAHDGNLDPAGFRAYLATGTDHPDASRDVRNLQKLLTMIHELGLSPAEERQARTTTLGLVQPDQIDDRATLERIIDPNAAVPTASAE